MYLGYNLQLILLIIIQLSLFLRISGLYENGATGLEDEEFKLEKWFSERLNIEENYNCDKPNPNKKKYNNKN